MKKIVAIAVRHPEQPNLFLHGLRADNHRWALAGGHAKLGEADDEAASRELKEETGLSGVKLDKIHNRTYGEADVHLFSCEYPEGASLSSQDDPDSEFVTFKFLDPTTHDNLHIPSERNVLVDWMKRSLKKAITYEKETEIIRENKKKPEAKASHKFKAAHWTHPNGHPRCLTCGDEERTGGVCEPLTKAGPKLKVEPFVVDPEMFDPRKHDFIVRVRRAGKNVGVLAVTHIKDGIMPFNLEVNKMFRRKGYATIMANHAQKISGKKIVRSPDMTQAGAAFADKFIKPAKPGLA